MRTAIDVIHRAEHDSSYEPSRVVIGYTDRLTATGVREQPLGTLNFHDDLAALYDRVDLVVPQHRIEYIKYTGVGVIWHKANRIDRVFGSTGGTTITAELLLMAANRVGSA